jgi:peptidoglycan biosynthesis protein MviN/MurJ (putative lipid II flippase)
MTLPFLIVDQLSFGTYEQKLPVCIALGGLVVGLLQYLLLKPNLKGSQLWIAGSVISWILGSSMVFLVNYTKQLNHDLFNNLILALINLILILSGGVVIGLVSGAITKRLLLKNLN